MNTGLKPIVNMGKVKRSLAEKDAILGESRKRVYLVSVSGGKDSSVTWLYMEKNYASKGLIVPYFADTKWEAEETYDYLLYLEKFFSKKIHRIQSEKCDGFEDMCIKRKMIPSRLKRFCTQELKIVPAQMYIESWQQKGYDVINVTGIRADESKHIRLKNAKEVNGVRWKVTPRREGEGKWKFAFFTGAKTVTKTSFKNRKGCIVFQPIVYWSLDDVFQYAKDNSMDLNPLYYKGSYRVGCHPCIMANTAEIGLLSPDTIQRVTVLEEAVSIAAGAKRTFWRGGGKFITMDELAKKYAYNTLGLELGCINPYGKCE